ncbi:MAG TPA: type II toxin-antitoxin system RelE/ParE family toxin [Bryobacteraceae bacterium]|jgi:plasmid stabilization system protein ParE|nr:type II toxin-antitoxin system RelE/ParE family toxin [Bryobacteraceae bacterium]
MTLSVFASASSAITPTPRGSGRMAGRRELIFPPLPYIVVYNLTDNAVEISRIFHGAQDWP